MPPVPCAETPALRSPCWSPWHLRSAPNGDFQRRELGAVGPLPTRHPGRLVRIWETNFRANQPKFSGLLPQFRLLAGARAILRGSLGCRTGHGHLDGQWRTLAPSVGGGQRMVFRLSGPSRSRPRDPPRGRKPGGPPVVVLTRRLWSTQFGPTRGLWAAPLVDQRGDPRGRSGLHGLEIFNVWISSRR